MRFPFATLSVLAVAALLPAQTQIVRGEIEDLRQTQGQFFLKCTGIPVQSTTLDLHTVVDTQAVLDVVNVGTATSPRLDVHAATPVARTFEMGDLRIGRSRRWEVDAPAGSFAFLFVDFTSMTGWMPFGASGAFLLSANAATLGSGLTDGEDKFELNFTMPNIPQLIGTSFTGQALIGDHGNWLFSNPDCKAVEAQ